jgi:hypothetical protein
LFLLLFSILWGSLLTLTLCAPYSYYPLFISMFAASIIIFLISKKYFKVSPKYYYISSVVLFIISYGVCSYLIFKPADFHYPNIKNISKEKKAVIFYCEGEMEKYTPYYANFFFENSSLFLKPIEAMRIKAIYHKVDVNTKNKDLLAVASEVKNSLLNHKPYYFYIAFSSYVPNIKDALHSAISDGCGDITVINYSSNENLASDLSKKINMHDLSSKGLTIKVSKPVYSYDLISDVFISKIINMPFKWDAILLIDNENVTSNTIKSSLIKYGYEDSQVVISNDIHKSMEYFKSNNFKNILYVNLRESSSGIKSDVLLPKSFEKYSNEFKITGIKSWGYDYKLVKASIIAFLECEKAK